MKNKRKIHSKIFRSQQKCFIFFESKFGKKRRSRRVDFIEKLALENEEAEESNIKATNI